ncbi:DUF1653 domain-containing protein [Patescibacteria group bacterium]|nr:DUF1653 domain-containing protein [Patescibacteria group bacterium]
MYRHYKSTGGSDHTYQVFGIARDFESGETLVIYKPLYTEQEKSGDHDKPIQEFLAEV